MRGLRCFCTDLRGCVARRLTSTTHSCTKVCAMREFLAPTLLFIGSHIVILLIAMQMYALGN